LTMAMTAMLRVSFQSDARALQSVNKALVGHPMSSDGPGPFKKVGTAFYTCHDEDESAVTTAFKKFVMAIDESVESLDSMSIMISRN